MTWINGRAYAAVVMALAILTTDCRKANEECDGPGTRAATPQPEAAEGTPGSVEPVDESSKQSGDSTMTLSVTSTEFANGAVIPKQFTGDGTDVSPPLAWTPVPANAQELALICDDPDAPVAEPWVHWVIYKISAGNAGLPENVAKKNSPPTPAGALQGKNSWGNIGYGGPAPPRGHGVHHYHFKLYALDAELSVAAGLTKAELLHAMEGHVIAQGELVGTYQR